MIEMLTLFPQNPQFWIKEEVRKNPQLITPPNILPLYDWQGKDIAYQLHGDWNIFTPYGWITVPSGFIMDGASVPRPFWGAFPPDGKYRAAAVLHDWIYSVQGMWVNLFYEGPRSNLFHLERWEADRLFLWAARQCNVDKAWWMWLGIKMGGGLAWKNSDGQPTIEPLHYQIT